MSLRGLDIPRGPPYRRLRRQTAARRGLPPPPSSRCGAGHEIAAERSRHMAASPTAGVPLCDIQAQYRELRPQFEAALARVLESGQVILGPEVAALEEEVARYCGDGLRRRLRLRHRRPVAGPARPGDRPRRRGHPAHLHVLRHGRLRLPHRCAARLRGHRPAHLQSGPVSGRKQDHAADARRAASSTCSASAPTWSRCGTWRSGTT